MCVCCIVVAITIARSRTAVLVVVSQAETSVL